jgi:hypothetical protein
MTTVKVVQYRTKPERSDENAELVRMVFAELALSDPGGLRYVTFRLDDGVSFVHVAIIEGDTNPLILSEAFKRFQSEVAERCVEGPIARDAVVVGAYAFDIP